LIDTKKHGRLAHLLDTTDEYMSKMMSQISDHQQVELAQEKEGQEKPAPIVANGSSDSKSLSSVVRICVLFSQS
jgi:hypothetical protein